MSTEPSSKPLPSHPSSSSRKPSSHPEGGGHPRKNQNFRVSAETIRKRQLGVRAVGVAIIVAAGSILGAQYKTYRQARDRVLLPEQGIDVDTEQNSTTEKNVETTATTTKDGPVDKTLSRLPQGEIAQGATNAPSGSTRRGASYNERQISFLKDRRGVLMKEKFDLERKLERVGDKIRREEEMQERRDTGLGNTK